VSKQTRVLVVDNHALIRQGIASLLASQPDIEIAGQAANGEQAIEMVQALEPDLVLMDVTMPGMSGTQATQHILEHLPDCKVIMLTDQDDEDHLFEAVHHGAMGYVHKNAATETLVPMVRRVLRGEAALSGRMAAKMLTAFRLVADQAAACPLDEDLPVLTHREREVLRCVADGAMDREIAVQLSISLSTVKTHVRNILAKLHATSRHQAALVAIREGLIRPPEPSSP
jgi:two-component system NarL family response regulator